MSTRDVPDAWAKLLVPAKMVDPRNGLASMTKLAEASGVHASTISAMMYGDRKTKTESIDKVADAIAVATNVPDSGMMRKRIHLIVGRSLKESSSFEPHPDADLLSGPERKAVNELIRLLAATKKTAVAGLRNRVEPIESDPDANLSAVAKKGDVERYTEFD